MNEGDTTTTGPDDQTRWDRRYRAREEAEPDPPRPLVRMASLLPITGVAVDLAGGDGGGGLFLARRGLDTTVADISPVALRRAEAFAAAAHVTLTTVAVDLADAELGPVLASIGTPDPAVITCCHYLNRTLLASVARDLPPRSRFLAAIATTTNLERHGRPSGRFLLDPGELDDLVLSSGHRRLRVLHRREGWADDRHRAELVVEAIDDRSAR